MSDIVIPITDDWLKIAFLEAELDKATDDAANSAEQERAKIVAWLQSEAESRSIDPIYGISDAVTLELLAEAIERLDHHREIGDG